MSRFSSLAAWLEWQESCHPRKIDLGLERVASVLQKLNFPKKPPVTITITGTNGKGSTVAFLEAIYCAQGYKVGSYTSPHLVYYNERIKINGIPVSDEWLCETFAKIDAARGEISLSYFEFGTLTALDIFAQQQVDVQLLEVGIGGRLDAVNIIDTDAAIISSIDIDHVDWLGTTREAIGFEKAGIFRSFVPAIVGDLQPPVSVFNVAKEKAAKLLCIQDDFYYTKDQNHWDWQSAAQNYLKLPLPNLQGEHQFRNASSVIMAVTQLQKYLPVSETAIHQGLTQTVLKGRFQLFPGNIPVLVDVAHNPQAVKTLIEHVEKHFAHKKIHAVFAMMRDKDISGVIQLMKTKIENWFIAPLTTPRTATEEMLQICFQQQAVTNVTMGFKTFQDAFQAAQSVAQPDELILIFGSFFLVSEYLAEFEK